VLGQQGEKDVMVEQSWTFTFTDTDHRMSLSEAARGLHKHGRAVLHDAWWETTRASNVIALADVPPIEDFLRTHRPDVAVPLITALRAGVSKHQRPRCGCFGPALREFAVPILQQIREQTGPGGVWAVFDRESGFVGHMEQHLTASTVLGLGAGPPPAEGPVKIMFDPRSMEGAVVTETTITSFLWVGREKAQGLSNRFADLPDRGHLMRATAEQLDIVHALRRSPAQVARHPGTLPRATSDLRSSELLAAACDLLETVKPPNVSVVLVALESWDGPVSDLVESVGHATI
jgi:hypothetical protein